MKNKLVLFGDFYYLVTIFHVIIFSCSLIVDFDIHVWDIRRPYLPYASFSEHKDVVTGTHLHKRYFTCILPTVPLTHTTWNGEAKIHFEIFFANFLFTLVTHWLCKTECLVALELLNMLVL